MAAYMVMSAEQPLPDGGGGEADSAIQGRNLARQLTSEEQMAQALAGRGTPVIGAGTNKPLLDAQRLANEYGGNPSDWAKMAGDSSAAHNVVSEIGQNFEVHWYENVVTHLVVELKTKIVGH